jgi:hypothetical protein
MPRTARAGSAPTSLLPIRAALLCFALAATCASNARAADASGSIRPAGGPDLVIYNDDMALVREPKTLSLPRGVSQVTLEGVAQRLDSTSVRLEGAGFRVLRQSFRYDLWNGDKVFRRFLGDSIVYRYGGKVYHGLLAGIDGDDLFIQRRDSADVLTMLKRSQVTEVEFPSKLKLSTRPSLAWTIESEKGGDARAELSYLTAGVHWSAEYTAVLDAQEKSVELTGWATIANRSGTSFNEARVSLVAGDIHRAGGAIDRGAASELTPEAPATKGPSEFFAYYIYPLAGTVSVENLGTIQASVVPPTRVAAKRGYRYDGARDGSNVRVQVEFGNDKDSGLGIPLPEGRVRVYKPDPSGGLALVGEDQIDATPPGERVKLLSGVAFDLVGDRSRISHTRVSRNVSEDQFRIKIRNAGSKAATVTVVEALYGNWEITAKSADFKKQNADEVEFSLPVPAGQESVLTYTVRYTF